MKLTAIQILQTVRLQHDPEPARFGILPLDEIINSALAAKRTTNVRSSKPPILELIPQAPRSGTTHLLYLLTATAILPLSLGGKDSCVAIIDTDNTFSVSRLVQQLRVAIASRKQQQQHGEANHPATGTTPGVDTTSETSTLTALLRHVHIFRPQSHPSLLATLDSLPTYFLPQTGENNNSTNPSLHRPLAFIALDSLPAFHWQTLAEREAKAFEEEETQPDQNQHENPSDLPSPSNSTSPPRTLTQSLHLLSQTFPTTPLLITNPSHFPRLSTFLQQASHHHPPLRTIPLTLSRQTTRPFPPMISLSEALREKGQREIATRKAGWRVGSSIPVGGREGGMMGFEIGISGERGIWVVEHG